MSLHFILDYNASCSLYCVAILAVLASEWTLLFLCYFLAFLESFHFQKEYFVLCSCLNSMPIPNFPPVEKWNEILHSLASIILFLVTHLERKFWYVRVAIWQSWCFRALQVGFICVIKSYAQVLFWLLSLQKAWPSSRDHFYLRD